MNKKFLSAILFGALTAASTSTFVSCKDYDDDIDQLQMQIDQNASSAASDLAAKVTALESQISTLNAAKQDLTSQLAAAKTEAANAAAAALEAAKGAQSGADAANKALAEAAAKVAVLETKVASLEGIVADLQTAKADLNAKVSDLQTQMAAVKADTKSNADAIAAANAEILAKYSELSGKISEVSTALGARIDVVDATLNTIKANYATKDELNTKAAELAAMDAQLNAQIATNLKYIETLQATVKDLAAKDAELAGKIEANYAELLGKINTMATEQAAALKDIQALQATVATLNSSYSTLSSAKADVTYVNEVKEGLTKLVEQLSTSTNTYSQYIEDLRDRVSKLEQGAAELQKKVDAAATQEALNAAIEDLKSQIREAGVASDATLAEAIEAVEASVAANAEEIASIKETLAGKADQSALDELAASLGLTQSDVMSITEGLVSLRGEIAEQKATLEGQIAAAETAAKEYAQAAVDGLNLRLVDAEELLAQLVAIGGEDLSAFITEDELADELADYITNEEFATQFAAQKEAVNKQIEDMTNAYSTFKNETEAKIKAEVDKLSGVNEALVTLKNAVEVLQDQVEALIKRIQSVVFIPQYRDAQNTVIAPVYNFTSSVYDYDYNRDRVISRAKTNPRVEMKFRVQPAEAANMLVEVSNKKDANNYMKLYVEKALETRAADQSVATIEKVVKDSEAGVIVVTAKINIDGIINDDYRPTTLVIGSDLYKTTDEAGNEKTESSKDVKLRITTEYFNLKGIEYPINDEMLRPETGIEVDAAGQYEIPYTDINVTHTPWNEAYVAINNLPVNVTNWGYDTNLKVWSGTVVSKKDGTSLISGNYRVKDNNGNDKWSNFVSKAKIAGFILDGEGRFKMDQSLGGSAIIDNVGNTMTLLLMDETFGYQSNGTPWKMYEITYVITMPDDKDKYDFGSFDRTWSPADANSNNVIDGSDSFVAWSNNANKDHKFSAGTQSLRQFDIKDSKGNPIKAATPAELAAKLDEAINAGKVVYTVTDSQGRVVEDNNNITPTLKIDKVNSKANLEVEFGAGTKYETKHIKAIVTTDYGVVEFTAVANLSYPTDFLVHEPRWTDGKFNVEAGNQVASYRDGKVGSSLPAGYTNHKAYTQTGVVEYVFEQVRNTYFENNIYYTPSGVNINSDDYLTLTTVPWAGSAKDLTNNVKIKVTVKVDGYEAASEAFNLNVVYPLQDKETKEMLQLTSGKQEINAATLINNQTVSVTQNVTLFDRYENELVKDGIFVDRVNATTGPDKNAAVWNITGLKYSKVVARAATNGAVVETVEIDENGNLSIEDPNISDDVVVTVKVETVGYTYGTVEGTFDVIVKKTY